MSKRINKTKEQILNDMKHVQKVKKEKELVRMIYPLIENLKTIYDAQTVLSALSGYIKAELQPKITAIKVNDLSIDLSNEKEGEILSSIKSIVEKIQDESAEDISELLQRFSDILPKIGANEYLKNTMNTIKLTDIITED